MSSSTSLLSPVLQVGNDYFLLANDFADYLRAQEEVDKAYKDQAEWTRRCVNEISF